MWYVVCGMLYVVCGELHVGVIIELGVHEDGPLLGAEGLGDEILGLGRGPVPCLDEHLGGDGQIVQSCEDKGSSKKRNTGDSLGIVRVTLK